MLSRLDKEIIGLISGDIPLVKRPFRDMAQSLGVEEDILLGRMRSFKRRGIMRKFSATLNHKKIGFRHNAMVVWSVPPRLVDKAGKTMASFDEVSHCYQRRDGDGWNYNLYSMVHGRTRGECLEAVKRISGSIGRKIDYRALFSSKEEKKAAPQFFKS